MQQRAAISIVRNIQPMSHEDKQEVRSNFNHGEGYFGIGLDHEAPIIVCDCISFIRNRGFYETGVFRIPGNLDVVNLLKQKYNDRFKTRELKEMNGYSVLNKHRPAPSVNDVASLLKLFFTELPEPLVPRYITEAMLEVAALNLRQEDECQYLGKLVKRIPSPNRECLGLLISFLRELCAFRKFNHMTANNLATCFVLSVFGRGKTHQQIILVTTGTKIIKQLIAGEIKIFMPSVKNVKKNTRYKDEVKGDKKTKTDDKKSPNVAVEDLSKPVKPKPTVPPRIPDRKPKANAQNKYDGFEDPKHVTKASSNRKVPDLPNRPDKKTGKSRPLPNPNATGYGQSGKNRFGNRNDGYGNNAGNLFGGV